MNLEKLKKALEIRKEIEYLDKKIVSLTAIKDQVKSDYSILDFQLEFIGIASFSVEDEEMNFIINYVIKHWKERKKKLEAEFEQL